MLVELGFEDREYAFAVRRADGESPEAMVARLRDELAEARAWWQPIATAPKDGTAVLLFHDGEIRTGRYSTRNGEVSPWGEFDRRSTCDGLPSHWMPLPAAPTEDRP